MERADFTEPLDGGLLSEGTIIVVRLPSLSNTNGSVVASVRNKVNAIDSCIKKFLTDVPDKKGWEKEKKMIFIYFFINDNW